jgi:hypothetical protein
VLEAERKLARSARTAALQSVVAEALVSTLSRSAAADAPDQLGAKLLLLNERVAQLLSSARLRRNGASTE